MKRWAPLATADIDRASVGIALAPRVDLRALRILSSRRVLYPLGGVLDARFVPDLCS